jgi:hypothetical protein
LKGVKSLRTGKAGGLDGKSNIPPAGRIALLSRSNRYQRKKGKLGRRAYLVKDQIGLRTLNGLSTKRRI